MALSLALCAGGCSFSYQLGSLFDKDDGDKTGSIGAKPSATPDLATMESDLAYARAAVVALFSGSPKETSAPWQNPTTGARGTITSVATAYNSAGRPCRDFLASYIRDSAEAWLQGDACRVEEGEWQVRSLRPWKRS